MLLSPKCSAFRLQMCSGKFRMTSNDWRELWAKGTWVSNRNHLKEPPHGSFGHGCSPTRGCQSLPGPGRDDERHVSPSDLAPVLRASSKVSHTQAPTIAFWWPLGNLRLHSFCWIVDRRWEGGLALASKNGVQWERRARDQHPFPQPVASSRSTVWFEKWTNIIPCPHGKQFWDCTYFLDTISNKTENKKKQNKTTTK